MPNVCNLEPDVKGEVGNIMNSEGEYTVDIDFVII